MWHYKLNRATESLASPKDKRSCGKTGCVQRWNDHSWGFCIYRPENGRAIQPHWRANQEHLMKIANILEAEGVRISAEKFAPKRSNILLLKSPEEKQAMIEFAHAPIYMFDVIDTSNKFFIPISFFLCCLLFYNRLHLYAASRSGRERAFSRPGLEANMYENCHWEPGVWGRG